MTDNGALINVEDIDMNEDVNFNEEVVEPVDEEAVRYKYADQRKKIREAIRKEKEEK